MSTNITHIVLVTTILLVISAISATIISSFQLADEEVLMKQALNGDQSQYFNSEVEEIYYDVDGKQEKIKVSYLTDEYRDMFNNESYLIIEAPTDLCDTYYEKCLVFKYNPLGIGVFEHSEVKRIGKLEE